MIRINDYKELAFLRFVEKQQGENYKLDNVETLIEDYLKLNCQNWNLKFFIKLFQDFVVRKYPEEIEDIRGIFSQFCEGSRSLIYIFPESISKKPSLQPFLSEFFKFVRSNWEYNNLNSYLKRMAIESYINNKGLDWWFEKVIYYYRDTLINLFNEFLRSPFYYNLYIDFGIWKNRKSEKSPNITNAEELSSIFSLQGFGLSFEERRQKLSYLVYNGGLVETKSVGNFVFNDDLLEKVTEDYSFLYIDFLHYLEQKSINISKSITYSVLLNYIEQYCEQYGRNKRSTLLKFATNMYKKENFFNNILSLLFNKRDSNEKRGLEFSFDRVKVPLAHGLILFPEYRNFTQFLSVYWNEIHHMTGDIMDIYYTLDDLQYNGSGYQRLNNMPNMKVANDDLPMLLVWKNFHSEIEQINLDTLENEEIFKVIKFFRDCIKKNLAFSQCVAETRGKVNNLIEKKRNIIEYNIEIKESKNIVVGDNNTIKNFRS